jgi:glyoxylase-like metal-dependent hydrolase (beta-lactamase superfamily II)
MIGKLLDRRRSCGGRLPLAVRHEGRRPLFRGTLAALAMISFGPAATAQVPGWCKPLPRPEYKSLERVQISDPWFEVYKVAPDTFAIYEPHQSEETISYLILGKETALLFDTGMGISDIRKVVQELTKLPVIALNSHTHNDHVGGNWQFDAIYSMDTDFSRQNAKGSSADAQAEIAPGEICGELPKSFNAKSYRTKPWTISKYIRDGDNLELGERSIEVIATPGHTPDSICLYDAANRLLFTGDTYYPATIWLYRPETDLQLYNSSLSRLELQPRNFQTLLGAHNIPVAPASVLPALAVAAGELQLPLLKEKGRCKPAGPGKKVCKVEGFSFLLKADP